MVTFLKKSSHIGRCFFLLLVLTPLLQSCFYQRKSKVVWNTDTETVDSLEFIEQHHYSVGFNFIVHKDTLSLCTEIPSRAQQLAIMPDSLCVFRGDELIVAELEIVAEYGEDSIWVKVARDQDTQGWVSERKLLPAVSPDDPISLAIYYFSGNHMVVTIVLVILLAVTMLIQWGLRKRGIFRSSYLAMVCSPYPLLLCLSMGGSAVFYASMQLFAPQAWTEYYYHPTLNPFAVTPLLGAFLFSFWLMILFFLATLDDVFRQLRFLRAVLSVFVTVTVLSVLYVFFSLTTLVYVGYPLYVLFVFFAFWYYFKNIHPRFQCGQCGRPLHKKGRCPNCGMIND